MVYLTLPISRNELRAMAIVFRRWLHLTDDECVPVVQLLDKFCITAGITYEIVDNDCIFHIHFYNNGVRDKIGRKLTSEEYDKYKKYFRGR